MEQKKKKQEDVLVVRDEKTGEISVVAGLDGKGYPNTKPAKPDRFMPILPARISRRSYAVTS